MTEAHNIFTYGSVLALLETIAGELLQVATRWRRDRCDVSPRHHPLSGER